MFVDHTPKSALDAGTQARLEQEVVLIYREHAAKLSRYAASFAHDPDGARDAVQEVFLRYFVERRYGRQIENPRAWLYHVLRNYLLDQQRTTTNREIIAENLDQMPGGAESPEGMIKHSQMAREIAAKLTDREMDCLRLRAQGSGYAEIADALGIRIGTVGALLARAQKKILPAARGERAIPAGIGEAMRFLFEKSEAYS